MTSAEATIIVTFICVPARTCVNFFSNLVDSPFNPEQQRRILSACSGNWFTNCVNCHCIRSQFVKCSVFIFTCHQKKNRSMKNYFSRRAGKVFRGIFAIFFFRRIKSKSRITEWIKLHNINIALCGRKLIFSHSIKLAHIFHPNIFSFIFSRITTEW